MKKILLLLVVLAGFISCKEKLVKKPDNLIARDKMIDAMYDLSILDAAKYQNTAATDSIIISPSQYIYKKYKIDSLQFAQSNVYYASNYVDYKDMYDELIQRIEVKKTLLDSVVGRAEKKEIKKKADSIKRVKVDTLKKESIKRIQLTTLRKDSLVLKKATNFRKTKNDSLRKPKIK